MILFDGVHLATNGPIEELHEFAQSIGLKREWFQDHPRHPHYDVWGKLASRIEVNCTARDIVQALRSKP
jgi:hypothetical protein